MGERGSRNPLLPGGISRYSRSKMYARRAQYKKRKTVPAPAAAPAARFVSKQVRGDKNGGTRNVPVRATVSGIDDNFLKSNLNFTSLNIH